MTKDELRQLPSVDRVWRALEARGSVDAYPRALVIREIRDAIDAVRAGETGAAAGAADPREAALQAVSARVEDRLRARGQGGPRRVINGTGVALHTNLGRAVLSEAARHAVAAVAGGYSDLELDLTTGERGSRLDHVEGLIREVTGAEAALVVNNNAAAVLLALDTLAAGRQVIVSRGQLVEIGGAFRVPAVMAKGGARLVEVGTTNKTYPRDYEEAVTPETALLLRVHTSNYRVVGFVAEVSLDELVELGRRRGLPVMEDLGSGALIDFATHGLPAEPTVQRSVRSGADVVTFSGDKLLGGPQAGIVIGRREVIARMRSNQLMRALRIDKLTLAALVATLRAYLEPGRAEGEVPALAALLAEPTALAAKARRLASRLRLRAGSLGRFSAEPGASPAGGGSLPGVELPTWVVALEPAAHGLTLNEVEAGLRRADPPVLVRASQGRILVDVRTLAKEELSMVVEAFAALAPGTGET
ncbi:MAG: L-seryl-tRNA(Sec) selenium transferase, partial [Bacillota bacterium]